MPQDNDVQQSASDIQTMTPPGISLPKGGGAIKGIGEKFAANPVNGTGSITVPIATSPGRSEFGPQLSLSYNSGAGNGPFGFGWNLSLPVISRKTDKGLPQYLDAEESDVFILSGSEDLVPVLPEHDSAWESIRTVDGIEYTIDRYRPRIEGLFARIERWSNRTDPEDIFWRSISKDNITTWYGKTDNSRIYGPEKPSRIFRWSICQSHDDKGNVIEYEYRKEDSTGIDFTQVHELNRTEATRSANRYLKYIRYGNHVPYLPELVHNQPWPGPSGEWHFQVVFDYGEHDTSVPKPDDAGAWLCRPDPFSSYRAGFEIRSYRLCRRVLMFHHFPDEDIGDHCLVHSTDFTYRYEQDHTSHPVFSFLISTTKTGYKRKEDGQYLSKSLPPLEFTYSPPAIQQDVQTVDAESLENLPAGLDNEGYQWLDLDGDGICGIFSEQSDGWYFKPNLSPVNIVREAALELTRPRFGPMRQVLEKPSANLASGSFRFMDIAGNGRLDLAAFSGATPGFYERDKENGWLTLRAFHRLPRIPWENPNLRLIDLTGDGFADVLITESDRLTWYPSLAEEGFGPAHHVHIPSDEEKGPYLVIANRSQAVFLADMSGDGLADLVRIRNGEVCYWPNMGYGHFGEKVTMDNAPWMDHKDLFDHRRLRLADIDGSGTTDMIYIGRAAVRIYHNRSGNSWGQAYHSRPFPGMDDPAAVNAVDLLGNGTACLVWSSSLPDHARSPMCYIDLMGGEKPHLLTGVKNNLGLETLIRYAPSTRFYLADKQAGQPWITRLPFPVHCVEKVTVTDKWRQTSFSTQYTYHHGYFDSAEREFRGFGRVEQIDTETYGTFAGKNAFSPYISDDQTLYQPPVKTVTWFHTGAFLDRERILNQFEKEYFPNRVEQILPEPDLSHLDLTNEEWPEALRACKGLALRSEVYELDVAALEKGCHEPTKLLTASMKNYRIHRIQPRIDHRHAVFLMTESETLTCHYELNLKEQPAAPDPRITHTLVLSTDPYGRPRQQAAIGYGRLNHFTTTDPAFSADTLALIRDVQAKQHISYTETRYTNDMDDQPDRYRHGLPCKVSTFELTGIQPHDHDFFLIEDLQGYRLSEVYQSHGIDVETLPYHRQPDNSTPQKRIVEQIRTLFFDQNLIDPMPLGELNPMGLSYETYKLALSDDLLDAVLRDKLEGLVEPGETYATAVHDILTRGGYYAWDGLWWIRSGRPGFAPDAGDHFFLPQQYVDPFNQTTRFTYDPYHIYVQQVSDPLENTTSVEAFDFRVLAPAMIKDLNDNLAAAAYDILGLPTGSAVMGKPGHGSGDTLAGFEQDLSLSEVCAFFTEDDDNESTARQWLGQATARFVYYLGEKREEDGSITYGHHPACACKIAREVHTRQSTADAPGPIQTAFAYSDGAGQLLVTKSPAEPEDEGGPIRWLATGKTIFNNKGKPVKQYEPYFCETGHRYEEPTEVGVTPLIYYDAVGRIIRIEQPDGTYSRVEFSPWFVAAYDANDTILEPGNAWYADYSAEAASAESQRAARLSSVHADTPAITHLDSLGREVVNIAHNRCLDDAGTPVEASLITYTKRDAEGKPLWIRDARGNRVMQYITPPVAEAVSEDPPAGFTPCYDMAGNLLYQRSMDSGDRWILNDAAGTPFYSWDSRSNILHTTYDPLRRPLTSELRNDTHADWIVVGCTRYGDEQGLPPEREAEVKILNLKGQPYKSYDQSGLVTNMRFDFKGNPLEVHRRPAVAYAHDIHWDTALTLAPDRVPEDRLMEETFQQVSEYDALNRVTRQYNWHQGPGSRVSVLEPVYNQRGKLGQEYVVLDAVKTVDGYAGGTRTAMVHRITYNAKGQRRTITYGNGTHTTYTYDPNTFRLVHMETRKQRDDSLLQDLQYTYDPSGNITEIVDNAQSAVIRNNIRVEPCSRYTYDALYRLIKARGREHDGQVLPNTPTHWHDTAFFSRRSHPHDDTAWRNYTQKYQYDAVGNILSMHHVAHGNTANNWHRHYQYALHSNRLMATGSTDEPFETYTGTPGLEYRYPCNAHGSMTAMPHLETMAWDFTEHLHHVARTAGHEGEDEVANNSSLSAWYRYDASRQRTRKRVVKQGGIVEERIYLGDLEIFRKYDGAETPVLERETLHIMDDQQRIAMVETRTDRDATGPAEQLIRFQLGNHLGSVGLELDAREQVISYEEYYPFGSTAYQAMNSELEVNPKRYRYTGMERDEETGFGYHTARYYTPWLGRWVLSDPSGIRDGLNVFEYVDNNPLVFSDLNGYCRISHERIHTTDETATYTPEDHQVDLPHVGEVFVRYPVSIQSSDTSRLDNAIQIGVRDTPAGVETEIRQFAQTTTTVYISGRDERVTESEWENDPLFEEVVEYYESQGMNEQEARRHAAQSSGLYHQGGGLHTRGPGGDFSILDRPIQEAPRGSSSGSIAVQRFQTYIYQRTEGSVMKPVYRIDWSVTTVRSRSGTTRTYSRPVFTRLYDIPEEERISPEASEAMGRFRAQQIFAVDQNRLEQGQRDIRNIRRASHLIQTIIQRRRAQDTTTRFLESMEEQRRLRQQPLIQTP